MIRLIGVEGKIFVLDLVSDMEGTISLTGGISKDVDENICTLEELKYIETSFKTKRVLMSEGDFTKLLTAIEDKQYGGGTAPYPSFTGNATKVLTVNAAEDDVEWTTALTQVYVDTQDKLLRDQIDLKADAIAVNQSLGTKADLINGLIPASQLPSYADDVLSFLNLASFPLVGEDGKIYIAEDINKTYRWGGSSYVEIGGGGVALGETSSTAYRGDRGKIAYDHSLSQGNPHNTTTSDISEGTNKYFTDLRVRNTVLSGLVKTDSSNVTNTDTIEVAVGKLATKSEAGGSVTTWVSAVSIGTAHPNITPTNNFIELARINGVLWIRGFFKNTGPILYESQPHLLKIDDINYKVVKRISGSAYIVRIPLNTVGMTIPTLGFGGSSGVCVDAASAVTSTQYFSILNITLLPSSDFYYIPPTCLGELVIK